MNKIFLIIAFLVFKSDKSFGQDKPRVYLSGIKDSLIKKSQLSDTAIRIVTNINIPKESIGVTIYFYGEGFSNVMTQEVFLGSNLRFMNNINWIRNMLTKGTRITVGGFTIKDPKSGKTIYFEESSYKIIDD